jgi:uncharacterized protein (TIGR04255 family)
METTLAGRRRLKLKNPPIVEAVLGLYVNQLPESIIESFRSCADELRSLGYSRLDPLTQHEVKVKFEEGVSSFDGRDSPHGLRFTGEDGIHVAQFNRDSFVFSRLGHYASWEQFRGEARRVWRTYSVAAGNPQVVRVGVRYINKLYIPEGAAADDYVRVSPKLPDAMSPAIQQMFMRLVLPVQNPSGQLIHTQMFMPVEKQGFVTLLFDNDFQFLTNEMTEDQVWDLLELVRDVKDAYFEDFTTPKLRDLFNA